MPSKQLCAVAQPRNALRSDARLPPSEAGEFADFTERAGALLKVSATGCIGTGSIRKRPLTTAAFFTSFSGRYARHCLSFDFIVLLLGRALLSIGAYQRQRVFRRTYKPTPSTPRSSVALFDTGSGREIFRPFLTATANQLPIRTTHGDH
jgi:hypothetical protein